jgi:PAS domain S-box-containing protein
MRHAQAVSNVGTFEWDPVRGWSIWSPEHYRMFGVEPPDEIVDAQPIFQAAVFAEDFVKVSRAWQRALEQQTVFRIEYRIRHPSGEVHWLESSGGPRYDDRGALLCLDGTVRDVTAVKRADEALRRFVSDAAHELRTPVAAILGAVELLLRRRNSLDEVQFDVLLEVLARQSHRLRDIHSSLLDLMEFENDVGRVELESVDIARLVEEVLIYVSPPDGASVEVLMDEPVAAIAEHARLRRIVIELLHNAFDHGGPRVTISARSVDGRVEVTVADNGVGVPADEVATLFLPFSHATPRASASGFGLAVVDRLAAVLGAAVSYEPPLEGGSAFVVRFPSIEGLTPAPVGAPSTR